MPTDHARAKRHAAAKRDRADAKRSKEARPTTVLLGETSPALHRPAWRHKPHTESPSPLAPRPRPCTSASPQRPGGRKQAALHPIMQAHPPCHLMRAHGWRNNPDKSMLNFGGCSPEAMSLYARRSCGPGGPCKCAASRRRYEHPTTAMRFLWLDPFEVAMRARVCATLYGAERRAGPSVARGAPLLPIGRVPVQIRSAHAPRTDDCMRLEEARPRHVSLLPMCPPILPSPQAMLICNTAIVSQRH